MKTNLNNNWQYFDSWSEDIFGNNGGEIVRIPHANKLVPFNNYDESEVQILCGYRHIVNLTVRPSSTYLLTFEGVAHYSEVYLNGQFVGKHACGYTAFTLDITSFLQSGDNEIVVKVDSSYTLNQPPFGNVVDYQTYGGIYREVYLTEKRGTYVDDVFVQAEPLKPVVAEIKLANFDSNAEVSVEIVDGDKVVYSTCYNTQNDSITVVMDAELELWELDNPKLYTLVVEVNDDSYQTTFGVRSAQFTRDGFLLNGKPVKIVGLNRHQCYPYVGYAAPESLQRLDARMLKQTLCLNAVRTSHYPQSQHFVDECDKLGLLVFTEIPGWQHIGDSEWQEQAKNNVHDMIVQYRNHPSVILWGVRINESLDNDELYTQTNAMAHMLDPTRQTGGVRYIKKSHLLEDVYTYNDFNREGATNRKQVCDKNVPYLVTEFNGHMFPTKPYDDILHRTKHTLLYARMLNMVAKDNQTCGCFGWCFVDYTTNKDFGSGDRMCYHGVMDMFRNPKMAAGVYRSQGETPFLDVCFTTEIGDYPECIIGDMYVLTNAEKIKVFKGGSYVGTFTKDNSPYTHLKHPPILIDDLIGDRLVTEDGFSAKDANKIKKAFATIRAKGLNGLGLGIKLLILSLSKKYKLSIDAIVGLYSKYVTSWGSSANQITIQAYNGDNLVLEKTVSSALSHTLEVSASHTTLVEKATYDMALVNIAERDQNGNVCPYIAKAVTLRTEGDIQIVGPTVVPLVGGQAGTLVKTVGKAGKGTLWVDDKPIYFDIEIR